MRLRYNNAKKFKDYLTAIKVINDEVNFVFDEHGLSVRAMDPARMALVSFTLKDSIEYECSEITRVGIDLEEFLKCFIKINKDTSITLNNTNENKLLATLEGKIKRNYTLDIIEIHDTETPIPTLNFNASSKQFVDNLLEAVECAIEYGGYNPTITIEQSGSELKLIMQDNGKKLEVPFQHGDEGIEIKTIQNSKASYSADYLKNMLKALRQISEMVNIDFSDNAPIKLSVENIEYFLAPRIIDD